MGIAMPDAWPGLLATSKGSLLNHRLEKDMTQRTGRTEEIVLCEIKPKTQEIFL